MFFFISLPYNLLLYFIIFVTSVYIGPGMSVPASRANDKFTSFVYVISKLVVIVTMQHSPIVIPNYFIIINLLDDIIDSICQIKFNGSFPIKLQIFRKTNIQHKQFLDWLGVYLVITQLLVMKSELYSPMKLDLSKKGLSEIMEQSYKDELEDSKYELAKLSNEEFLSQYLQLNQTKSIMNEYKHLLEPPTCEYYTRFDFNQTQKKEKMKLEIKDSIQNGMKRIMNFFSKQQLKALATKKLTQSAEREKLSSSRKQKREVFYQALRSSRKKQEQKEGKDEKQDSIKELSTSKLESPKKHATTQQTIQDLFTRIEVVGDNRDKIKKKWYGWGEKGKIQQKQAILQQWSSNHQLMKSLLETLLQKLTKQLGSIEVFNQLKISNQTSVLQSLSSRTYSDKEKSLVSTRIDKSLRSEQIKMIYRFSSWFNKLLLDQRQIEYIQNLKKQ